MKINQGNDKIVFESRVNYKFLISEGSSGLFL